LNYLPIIGIEVHIELKTESKMFCGCSAQHFQVQPNTHTCPVCLGLPGALPVPNQQAIEWCLMIGLALGCQISKESKFDRKNYFYPDLPKGYQISQYDQPFCKKGKLQITNPKFQINSKSQIPSTKQIRINRVHMEEDTAKLVHRRIEFTTSETRSSTRLVCDKSIANKFAIPKLYSEEATLIDFNRSGVPLVEIVTEPDIHSSEEAVLYLKKLQQIIRYLGVSDCDMEKGSMRCEANISLASQQISNLKSQFSNKFKVQKLKIPNYRVEVKNINSFKFVQKAIDYEIKRQKKALEAGKTLVQETRGFDDDRRKTFSQRGKEEAHDYRYFPEPDIPEVKLLNGQIAKLSNCLPELPDKKRKRFIEEYGLSRHNAEILTRKRETADFFDNLICQVRKFESFKSKSEISSLAKMIVNKRINIKKLTPQQLIKQLQQQKANQITDQGQLEKVINQVLKENEKAIEDYKKGKREVIGFLIGQVMGETRGKAEPQAAKKMLVDKLEQTS